MPEKRIPTWVFLVFLLALAAVVWLTDAIVAWVLPGR